jgi:2-polyprenyl-3-methyl-5-hydroxy-6-metoxy-1,4-benzoquinol methylase
MQTSTIRNHNNEHNDNSRKYNYDFDLVLREYMLKTFIPFMPAGSALEMGCFEGAMTDSLSKLYDNLTVIEASELLIQKAKTNVSPQVKFIHSMFENAGDIGTHDAIFLIHTLEHLDDPVSVLKIANNWLSDTGRFFVCVPNANAPSRQIAVKMGLIENNAAVTPAEFEHGHRITYTLDTLERDVKKSGLKIIQRGGVFFKPLANFQFDKLMQTDIISKSYLDGCYELGQTYPDLCASIFLICEKGSSS